MTGVPSSRMSRDWFPTVEANIDYRFMTCATLGPCVEIGDELAISMEFDTSRTELYNDFMAMDEENTANGSDRKLVTWLPEYRVPILLIALGDDCTAVYIQSKKQMFYASDMISLPAGVPAGTILIANYTEDLTVDNVRMPRVLVYDVATWGLSEKKHVFEDFRSIAPAARYKLLRKEFEKLLRASPNKTIILQWVGFVEGALKFTTGEIPVGHSVSSMVYMGINATCPVRIINA
jgi:hypothetical protein